MRKTEWLPEEYQELNFDHEHSFVSSELDFYSSSRADISRDEIVVARFDTRIGGLTIESRSIAHAWTDGGGCIVSRGFDNYGVELDDRADVVAHGWWPGTIEMEMRV